MNNSRQIEHPTAAGMSLGDIYYILFRNKWKIILCALAGFAAAAGVYFFKQPLYQSQAELLIKYVPQTPAIALTGDQKVITPGGSDVINAEIRILTSLDLAEEVVTNIGASNILAQAGGGGNPISAAVVIQRNLEAMPAGRGSSVILVTFKHPDPRVVQPVLQTLIDDYYQKNYEIHAAPGQFVDALIKEQSALSLQLNGTEQQLADLKNKASILSLDGSQKDLANQIAKIRGNILDAEATLSVYETVMKLGNTNETLNLEATNAPPPVPADQLGAYNVVCATLGILRKKAVGYMAQGFTSTNALVREVNDQIAKAEATKAALEKKYPQISGMGDIASTQTGSAAPSGADIRRTQLAQVAALQARIKAWDKQLDDLQTDATNLNNLAPALAQLEQTRNIQQANLQNLSVGLEKSRIDAALDTGQSPNIKIVQRPSPPSLVLEKTYKIIGMLAFGGIALGLALAFVTELFLDRTVKRPTEVEAKLKLPLFLAIPDVSRNGHVRRLEVPKRPQLQMQNAGADDQPAPAGETAPGRNGGHNGSLELVSLEKNRALTAFYDALRDRLAVYFEVKNLTHKPKLVAVTGASPGAGVSTIAAGLAASLSETRDGNVLLVDMNIEHGAAQQFYKGRANCGLDAALKTETKEGALVQENLYVVNGNANSNELPHVLPKRFAALVPKLKASDFDYIIFDMPPVAQTSITSRLARFMDMTLLVVESEKTDRDVVQHANQWLVGAGATVSVVLNKTRKYIPARLHQEFLGDK